MKILGYTLLFILLAPLSAVYSGFTISTLWGWFVIPTFSAPELTIPVAIGLSLLVRFLTYQVPVEDDEREAEDKAIRAVTFAVVFPSVALFVGWITTMFM